MVPRVSRKDILHDIDDSLKNLQVDYVDLYWLHHDDEKISVEEIIDTLVSLVREGKIRYFGCSNWNTARIREALDYSRKKKIPEFVGNQVMYNLAKYNQERLDQEIMFGMTSEMYALHKKKDWQLCVIHLRRRDIFPVQTRKISWKIQFTIIQENSTKMKSVGCG